MPKDSIDAKMIRTEIDKVLPRKLQDARKLLKGFEQYLRTESDKVLLRATEKILKTSPQLDAASFSTWILALDDALDELRNSLINE
jgi:hypothetical protein